jgi:hypothetical protein
MWLGTDHAPLEATDGSVQCSAYLGDCGVPAPMAVLWVWIQCGLPLDAHTRFFGAPGSRGVWLIPLPSAAVTGGPDALVGSGRPDLSMVTLWEVVCLPPSTGYSFPSVLAVIYHLCQPAVSLQHACLVLTLRPSPCLPCARPTPFSSSSHTAFSLSVNSQLKCHLFRGAFPDLSMQNSPLFHFLSHYHFFSYIYHVLKYICLFEDEKVTSWFTELFFCCLSLFPE